MSKKTSTHGRGGTTGQHYRAKPDLREYTTPPAGPVTVTRADGTVEEIAAKPAKVATRPKRRRPKPQPDPIPIDRIRPVPAPAPTAPVPGMRPVNMAGRIRTQPVDNGVPRRRDDAPPDQVCPTCGAQPGEPCRDRSGRSLRGSHSLR